MALAMNPDQLDAVNEYLSRRPAPSDAPQPRNEESIAVSFGDGFKAQVYPNGDGTASLGRVEATGDVVIPQTLEGLLLTEVRAAAFAHQDAITSLELPDAIQTVGTNAFAYASNLESLKLPASTVKLDGFWLRECRSLRRLILPDAAEEIPAGFLSSAPVEHLTIGSGTHTIATGLFSHDPVKIIEVSPDNPYLSTDGVLLFDRAGSRVIAQAVEAARVEVPDGVRVIGHKAFAYRFELEEVLLPDTLETVESYAFFQSGLRSFAAPVSLRSMESKALYHCDRLTVLTLNEGLEAVGDEPWGYSAVERVRIPASVTALGKHLCEHTGLRASGSSGTFTVDEGNAVYALEPDGSLYRKQGGDFILVDFLDSSGRSCTVRSGTVLVEEGCFQRHGSLEQVSLPEGVREIGPMAFRGCTRLREVGLPSTLHTIGAQAFLDTAVESLDLPAALGDLGRMALITRGGNRSTSVPTLQSLTVDEGNGRFYMEGGFLCRRRPSLPGDSAAVYAGRSDEVSIPSAVTDLDDYCMAGIVSVKHLIIHGHMVNVGLSALALGSMPEKVTFLLEDDPEGRDEFSLCPPREAGCERLLQLAFHGRFVDPAAFADLCDHFSLHEGDLYDRARYTLMRLEDPYGLKADCRDRFEKFISRECEAVSLALACRNDRESLDRLFDCGLLDGEQVVRCIDAVAEAGFVEMTSHMLDRKNERADAFVTDFEL